MPQEDTAFADAAQAGYKWVSKLAVTVYDKPVKGKRVAHLFVGDWIREGAKQNGRTKIEFRGGEGYIDNNAIGNKRTLEVYFIDVGQGDAILIETPENKRILIDGGADKSAHSYLKWKYDFDKYYKVFDAVILTHGDRDHSHGLMRILKDPGVVVKAVYHNGISKIGDYNLGTTVETPQGKLLVDLYDDIEDLTPKYNQLTKTYKDWHDIVKKLKRRASLHDQSFVCKRVDHTTPDLMIGNLKIEFLNPVAVNHNGAPALHWFSGADKTLNGNSVGVMLTYGSAKMLLCGDLNREAEDVFLTTNKEKNLSTHVFKANHHGSHKFTTHLLDTVEPWASVVSSGDVPDYGHPRANLLGSLGRYSYDKIQEPLLFSTELARTFKKIPESKLKDRDKQLYEMRSEGVITVRTNGQWLAAGRVYEKTEYDPNQKVKQSWKWEAYAWDLANGAKLVYNLV